MFCCGDYILHLGRHEVYTFAQICIFSFKATPFSQKYKFIILLFYLNFYGCCTSYYNIPSSLPDGAWMRNEERSAWKNEIRGKSVGAGAFDDSWETWVQILAFTSILPFENDGFLLSLKKRSRFKSPLCVDTPPPRYGGGADVFCNTHSPVELLS